MRRVAVLTSIALLLAATVGASGTAGAEERYPDDGGLRLNQMQVLGSHNSFKKVLQPELQVALTAYFDSLGLDGEAVVGEWMYEHRPLPEQFDDLGVRQIELDVYPDPEGGRYAERRAQEYAGLPRDPGIPELLEPGTKVMHIAEIDVESTCWTLASCLGHVKTWSDANPGHAPMMILIEAKADNIGDPLGLGFLPPLPWDATALDTLDAEIRAAFDPEDIITPDEVRGSRATLEEAVLTDGWPTLAESRGRVLFGFDNGGSLQSTYLSGHPSAQGRVMFPSGSEPGNPETAFIKYNDPVGDFAKIQAAVAQGYLVRTRADADPQQRNPDLLADRDQAIASGAQFVSTDFEEPNLALSDYSVAMPGGTPARCNPISAPQTCTPGDIENPAWLQPEPPPEETTTTTTTGPGPTTSVWPTSIPPTSVPPTSAPGPAAAPAPAVAASPRFTG